MYYTHRCSYCSKLFYTYDTNKSNAARKLYEGIKEHLQEYNEDHKEYEFDEDPDIEVAQMYKAMDEVSDEPAGAYEI